METIISEVLGYWKRRLSGHFGVAFLIAYAVLNIKVISIYFLWDEGASNFISYLECYHVFETPQINLIIYSSIIAIVYSISVQYVDLIIELATNAAIKKRNRIKLEKLEDNKTSIIKETELQQEIFQQNKRRNRSDWNSMLLLKRAVDEVKLNEIETKLIKQRWESIEINDLNSIANLKNAIDRADINFENVDLRNPFEVMKLDVQSLFIYLNEQYCEIDKIIGTTRTLSKNNNEYISGSNNKIRDSIQDVSQTVSDLIKNIKHSWGVIMRTSNAIFGEE